jgi:hypothetical protein
LGWDIGEGNSNEEHSGKDADMFDALRRKGFQILFLSHAEAILAQDFPSAAKELEDVLLGFQIPVQEIIASGGGEAHGTQRLRKSLAALGWKKDKFEIKKIINGIERESITHEIDHVKAFTVNGRECTLALEIEWNNKDPFYDRDLENFKRLHAEGVMSAGIIITRGASLQDEMLSMVRRFVAENEVDSFEMLARHGVRPTERQREQVLDRASRGKSFQDSWAEHFVSDKFGAATTHWRKLQDRVDRGVGNPCPLLLIGLPAGIVEF